MSIDQSEEAYLKTYEPFRPDEYDRYKPRGSVVAGRKLLPASHRLARLLYAESGFTLSDDRIIVSDILKISPLQMLQVCEDLRSISESSYGNYLSKLLDTREFVIAIRQRGVDWDYIFSHWNPGIVTYEAFFRGVIFGAGENLLEGLLSLLRLCSGFIVNLGWLRKLIKIAGVDAKKLEDLDAEVDGFFNGMIMIFSHPIDTVEKMFGQYWNDLIAAIDKFDFYEAGKVFGKMLVDIIDFAENVAGLIKSVPDAAKAGAKIIKRGSQIAVAVSKILGGCVKELVDMSLSGGSFAMLASGAFITRSGNRLIVMCLFNDEVKGIVSVSSNRVKQFVTGAKSFDEDLMLKLEPIMGSASETHVTSLASEL